MTFKKLKKNKDRPSARLEGPRQGWIFKFPGPRVWDIYIFFFAILYKG
jgi:hypothetical protein